MQENYPPANQSEAWVDLRAYDQSGFNRGRPGWLVLLWWFLQAIIFPISLHSSHGVRVALLRLFGAQIGRDVVIRPTARFTYPWKVTIGDASWIGDDVVFYSLDSITVGEHCVVSQETYLCTGSHDVQDPRFGLITAPIEIQSGAWVATDCFVGPGVTIGANTVVGTRSTVTKSLPAGQICYGTPCRPVKPRMMRPATQSDPK
ncbi:MAG: hormogonium polysaccharide biosynthesis acetyltransferase HpsU [Cyanobacteria bacterium P01_H01_bin.121]